MDLLISLGVNSTLAIQFVQFVLVYAVLKYVLFKPYFQAHNERSERTVGKAELAERYVAEAREMEDKFAERAQQANEAYRAIYDKSRHEAMREYDHLIAQARLKARDLTDAARVKIRSEMDTARSRLDQDIPDVARLISNKLIGKDLHA